ncbi:MAG: DEAD/DEAH box helicase [Erysipelotrichaceae bacterium]|nr:DEAD/DEAH box helicase [Erysipelotrichaceae bacterium]
MINRNELKPEIQALIEEKRFRDFTPIQEKVYPLIMKGKDVVGISATGTGKSHAFIIPVLQLVDTQKDSIQAVITAPTRELARQLYKQFAEINKYDSSYRIKLISSGSDKNRMVEELNVQPHIVIGTVGRLKDMFVDEAVLRLDQAKILVIDEADMTLELGFIDDVDQICSRLNRKLQMLVFSATIPTQLQPFLRRYMYRPTIVEATEEHENNPKIEHVLVNCRHLTYQEKLLRILPGINPYVCLIFARTKEEVKSTSELLKSNGYSLIELHGDLTTRQRKQALKAIDSDNVSYIVCSDIMARGLDISSVSHVISLGLPSSLDYYTHRSGRTGRAGRSGVSYVLFNESDIPGLKTLRNKGFEFEYRDYRKDGWVTVKPFDFRPTRNKTEFDEEIDKIRKRPVKKVKPGYKKKIKEEIESVRRRQRRLMIKASIKQQQKERAKLRQRSKGSDK